jgi:hypothetical protein
MKSETSGDADHLAFELTNRWIGSENMIRMNRPSQRHIENRKQPLRTVASTGFIKDNENRELNHMRISWTESKALFLRMLRQKTKKKIMLSQTGRC